jgi:hypothetical protein
MMPSTTKERYFPYSFKSDPGSAKSKLKKRFEHAKPREHILAIGIADRMTVRQIAAKVHEYLQK